jgi:phosphoglucosamine mutase
MKSTGAGLAELTAPMRRYPQVLMNVRVAGRFDPMTKPSVLAVVDALQRQFDGRGRIVLRASGTEPVIRVMVEGYDAGLVKKGARDIAAAVEAVAADEGGLGAPGAAVLPADAPVDEATAETWAGLAVTRRRS